MAHLSRSGWGSIVGDSDCWPQMFVVTPAPCRPCAPAAPAHTHLQALPPVSSPGRLSGSLGFRVSGPAGEGATRTQHPWVPQPLASFCVCLWACLQWLWSRLLRKAGTEVQRFGLGVPTCPGRCTRVHTAVLQVGRLAVGECVHAIPFLAKLVTAWGLGIGCPPPGRHFPLVHWRLIFQGSAQMSPSPRGVLALPIQVDGPHILCDLHILFIPLVAVLPVCNHHCYKTP